MNDRERESKKRQSSFSISRQPAKAAVSPRFSPLGTSVVKHFNRKVIQCFPDSSNFDHFNNCLFSTLECPNYGSLNNADRVITYGRRNYCDSGKGPPAQECQLYVHLSEGVTLNTDATGWLNGGHPIVADGQVSRRVCFHYGNNCCHWARNIRVRNYGYYYVYYLSGTPTCSLRYCSTN